MPVKKGWLWAAAAAVSLSGFCLADRLEVPLNDSWRFYRADASGAAAPGFDDSSWSVVTVPHTYNALDGQDGGSNYYRGPAWYRKRLTIPADYSGRRVYLYFESVGKKADVYCNGTLVGTHLGAYAAFCYDITSQVIFGAENVIAVRADNSSSIQIAPLSGDFNQYGGICRPVRLVITEPVHITLLDYASPGVYLTPTNVSAASADLQVKVLVRNAAVAERTVTVRAKVYDAAQNLVDTLQTLQTIPAGTTQTVVMNAQILQPHLWNGRADPYLYSVLTEIEADGVIADAVRQPLGFRFFRVDAEEGFFLNGQYLDLHGVAIHEDRTDKGRAISDADRLEDMQLMAEMGCSWIRLSHYQHAQKVYELADEFGIILSTEIPIVDSVVFTTDFINNCKDQLRELIRQNYNHPSVCFWLLYNELTTSSSESIIQQLHDLAKTEDPTRLTSVAHNNTSDTAAWSYITDTLGYNRYFGWYGSTPASYIAVWADSIHSSRSGDKIGITEYGAGANPYQHEEYAAWPSPGGPWHPEEYQCTFHEVYWKAMKERPFLWCKTIWNGFDFAVDSRNEGSQPGLNDKGMVTRDRTLKKDVFYWYKANWTTEPMVYITGRRFTPRTTCPKYVKVYSNCESVDLFVNGRSYGSRTSSDHIFLWEETIHLKVGENEIRAVGVSGGQEYTDSCIWRFEIDNTVPVAAVSASHYETANPPQNAVDGNLTTRWAGNNYPWILFDFGSPRSVEKIAIAFYLGEQRRYTFGVEASNDQSTWISLISSAQSSGTTRALEEFDVPDTTARYIRINGYGNTGPYPTWTSFYEVKFYTNLSPDCAFWRSVNCGYSCDFDGPQGQPDCRVDLYDLQEMARQWMEDYRQTIQPTDPGTSRLMAYWPMEGTFQDVTGNGYNAVSGGSPVFDSGRVGQSVYFDGTDDVSYLNCQNSSGLHLTTGATVCAWVKSSGMTDPWASVVTKGVSAWRLIRNNETNSISFHFNQAGGGEYQANGTTPVLDGQWHHIAGVYTGSRIQLYIDGRLEAESSAGPVNTSTDPVYIGSRVNATSTRNWIGNIDDVRIYDIALTEAQILFLAQGQPYQVIPQPTRPADLTSDGVINLDDLALFVRQWMACSDPATPFCL
ncbi:MAG TPA: glycoside hydrolase family 2 TIM barrel-domain containing protein [Anaerohalosphaeraceae bacterium]|nr:glycoside hydrolase family 2 TIM barrel-domain containing protein [Anaerohalosphaeraceae bacterium]HOL87619.1 glycoside hydrolase family 2 TIM barrel-domain containing protein [Anaerohalosphaeraceae bacterium]